MGKPDNGLGNEGLKFKSEKNSGAKAQDKYDRYKLQVILQSFFKCFKANVKIDFSNGLIFPYERKNDFEMIFIKACPAVQVFGGRKRSMVRTCIVRKYLVLWSV